MSLKKSFYLYCSMIIIFCFVLHSRILSQDEKWINEAKIFLAAHPENKGLGLVIQAVEQLDVKACNPYGNDMTSILKNGWTGQNQKMQDLLNSQSGALQAAIQAGESGLVVLPPFKEQSSPIPNFLKAQLITKLLSVDARRMEAAGMIDQAAQRAMQGACFGDVFCAREQSMISHLIGIACISISCRSLESILCHPNLSTQAAQWVGTKSFELDKKHIGIAEAYRQECRNLFIGLSQRGNPPLSEIEYNKAWDVILSNLGKPYWERRKIDESFFREITNNEELIKGFKGFDFRDSIIRGDLAVTHLRLCQALCALRLQKKELIEQFPDPFTGKSLHVTQERIYSEGPDMMDQGGVLPYDPTNGTISPGDIAVSGYAMK